MTFLADLKVAKWLHLPWVCNSVSRQIIYCLKSKTYIDTPVYETRFSRKKRNNQFFKYHFNYFYLCFTFCFRPKVNFDSIFQIC